VRRPQYRLRIGDVRVFYDVFGRTVEVLAIVAKIGGSVMARTVRKFKVKEVPLSEIKDDLSRYLREAETQEIVFTRHGKPAGILIGFESEEDWFDYRLEHDARFLRRIEQARSSLRAGGGIRLEELEPEQQQRLGWSQHK
jgi:prevent-host-death family protein